MYTYVFRLLLVSSDVLAIVRMIWAHDSDSFSP